ncbi:MAG: DUF4321 domain-containing protein [candidate division Zixibacteria bacterium]|nr:DUF4321 domain-containing protein [candidate division Zixibacteria bacterium]NIR63846.1 DUF4321 domain-containing protein [candidate division Zixibacteria bacterium]NIS14965.1 DUF4321 domain-containing protein [candidate division Zixibacteria bacterium]NIS45802.1 DUF4321 domain-containing protein [candidate division Zixibacteria bacterium]NIT51491.1 DUF4321 domain-containing protein [candidate division Zixibacteria bacterium]
MTRRDMMLLIFSLILAGIVGGLIGDIVGHYLPDGALKTLFQKNITPGFDTGQVDFYVISFSFGIRVGINFMSVLFMILVLIYFRWWYI